MALLSRKGTFGTSQVIKMALSMKMQSAQMVAGSRRMAMASPRVARAFSSRTVSAAPVSVAAAPRTQRASRASRVVVEAVKKSVGDLKKADLEGKRVLVRADLNVPLDKSLNITDDTRIRAAIPTLKYLMDNGAKVLLTSHLVSDGRASIAFHALIHRAAGGRRQRGQQPGISCERLQRPGRWDRAPPFASSSCHPSHVVASAPQGRPKGEDKAADKKKFSLAPVVGRLSECLGKEVSFAALRPAYPPISPPRPSFCVSLIVYS
jgi:hypothetical protein